MIVSYKTRKLTLTAYSNSVDTNLRDKNQGHAEEAAEDDRQRDEGEGRVLLARDHQRHWRRDQAQHHHVVDAHPHVAGVVDLPHLH